MLKNISDKDLKILVFLFLFVIVVGIGYWGIKPRIQSFISMQDEIDEATYTKELNEMKAMNAFSVSAQADDYEAKIKESKYKFYPIMSSSEIDRMVTDFAVSSNLEIFDLRFSMPKKPSDRMAYQYSELYKQQKEARAAYEASFAKEDELESMAKEAEEDVKGSKKEDKKDKKEKEELPEPTLDLFGPEDSYVPNTDVYAVPVSLTLAGSEADIKKFINNLIALDEKVLILNYSWGDYKYVVRRDATGNIIPSSISPEDGIERKTLSIKFEIYMCDPPKDKTNTSEETTGTIEIEEKEPGE